MYAVLPSPHRYPVNSHWCILCVGKLCHFSYLPFLFLISSPLFELTTYLALINIHCSILWDTCHFSLWNVKSHWWWLGCIWSLIVSLHRLVLFWILSSILNCNNVNSVSAFLFKYVLNYHMSSQAVVLLHKSESVMENSGVCMCACMYQWLVLGSYLYGTSFFFSCRKHQCLNF